ncbi:hypothetical protein ACFLYO_06920 [Chloroflexota bacterium]
MTKQLSKPWMLALIVVPLLAGVLAILSAGQMLAQGSPSANGGHVLPLDEGYRALQYGRQISSGQPFQYNAGTAPTTGTTGLLYVLLLGGGFILGIGSGTMPGVVVWLNMGLFGVAAALIVDLTRRAADGLLDHSPYAAQPAPVWQPWLAGLLAGLLWAGSGWIVWGALNGTADMLLMTLLLATLWAFSTDRVRLTALLATLAVLTGPLALLLAGLLLAAQLIFDPAEYNDRQRRFLWGCLPVGVALLLGLLTFFLTGFLIPTGLLAHSWFTMQPFDLGAILPAIGMTVVVLWGRLLGVSAAADGRWHVFPLALVFALIGIAPLWRRGRVREKRLAIICLGWLILGVLCAATLQTATGQYFRILLPIYAVLLVPLAVALVWLGATLAGALRRRTGSGYAPGFVGLLGAVLLMAWIIFTLADFDRAYRQDTRTIANQQMALADWLQANTPNDALVAASDVGVFRYSGARETLDLSGATSADMLGSSWHGPGSLYEALETRQPDYYAVYPDTGPPFYDLAVAPALLGDELFRAEVKDWSAAASWGGVQVITQPDWSDVALVEQPQQPHLLAELAAWTPVDKLDVADLDSEQAHAYQGQQIGAPAGFLTEPRRLAYSDAPDLILTDGGRLLNRGAAFTLQTPDPGHWLLLVARVHQAEPITLRVRVDGSDGGLWKIPALPNTWLETAFLIRPELVRRSTSRIELQIENVTPTTQYGAFHYWAYQGDLDPLPPAPGTISAAAFGDIARLRGFDLPGLIFAPGEDLPLTLHWQTLDPPPAEYRFVVEIIDPQGDAPDNGLVQIEGVPRGGTRPFWTWQNGEAVSDDLTLALPADAIPGEYMLLLSLVDGTTGARLPIIGGADWGDSRLVLGTITLR